MTLRSGRPPQRRSPSSPYSRSWRGGLILECADASGYIRKTPARTESQQKGGAYNACPHWKECRRSDTRHSGKMIVCSTPVEGSGDIASMICAISTGSSSEQQRSSRNSRWRMEICWIGRLFLRLLGLVLHGFRLRRLELFRYNGPRDGVDVHFLDPALTRDLDVERVNELSAFTLELRSPHFTGRHFLERGCASSCEADLRFAP